VADTATARLCCNSADLCNRALAPQLAIKMPEPRDLTAAHHPLHPHAPHPTLNTAFLAMLLVVAALVALALVTLVRHKKRSRGPPKAKQTLSLSSASSGSSTTSSEKSKATTLTTATSAPAEKSGTLVQVSKSRGVLVGQELLEPLIGVSFCLFCLFGKFFLTSGQFWGG
jgi:H+/Cl- antiporter ClcA